MENSLSMSARWLHWSRHMETTNHVQVRLPQFSMESGLHSWHSIRAEILSINLNIVSQWHHVVENRIQAHIINAFRAKQTDNNSAKVSEKDFILYWGNLQQVFTYRHRHHHHHHLRQCPPPPPCKCLPGILNLNFFHIILSANRLAVF